MSDENTTNLPILDDIIETGDADKAVHQPSSKVQSSLWGDDEIIAPPATDIHEEADLHTAVDEPADIARLFAEDPSIEDEAEQVEISLSTEADEVVPTEEPIHVETPAEIVEAQQVPTETLDIDALTDEIMTSMMPELEQAVREKIRQTLNKHLPGDTEPD